MRVFLIVGAALAVVAWITRRIPNSALTGGSPYTAKNLLACLLIIGIGAVMVAAVVASGGA